MRNAHNDGHTADFERAVDAQLCAYNSAFADLGLRFRWDAQTMLSLIAIDGEQARVIAYIETHQSHLLNAYSAEFLSEAILAKKSAQMPDALPTYVAPSNARTARASTGFSLSDYWAGEQGLPALAGA